MSKKQKRSKNHQKNNITKGIFTVLEQESNKPFTYKDIAEKLWTKEFSRIRIWIDRPSHSSEDVSDYVLWNFKSDEIEKIEDKYLDIEWLIKEFLDK